MASKDRKGWEKSNTKAWWSGLLALALISSPSKANTGDFNGDGFQDLAVSALDESIGGWEDAGAVRIFYGSPSGLSSAGIQMFHLNTPGIADDAQPGSSFGIALTVGNFNGDLFDDLAISAVVPRVQGALMAGSVHILFGSEQGLVTTGSQRLTQASLGLGQELMSFDIFGSAIIGGFFNDDIYCDLAIGAPKEDRPGRPQCGVVHVVYGSSKGLNPEQRQLWSQDSTGIKDTCESFDRFGAALAARDFNGDGRDDLAIGVPGEVVNGELDAGGVAVIFGAPLGLDSSGDQFFTQNSPGIKGRAERFDRWGSVLAAGELDRGRFADLVVSAPSESVDSVVRAGAVWVLFGSESGITERDFVFEQHKVNNSGHLIPESPEPHDFFGAALAVGDMNFDGVDELAIGIGGEDLGFLFSGGNEGMVQVIVGEPDGFDGFDGFGHFAITQEFDWVPGKAEERDNFGDGLALGDFDGDGPADLAIGVPGESFGSIEHCGAFQVFFGSRSHGISGVDPQWWDQSSHGVPGGNESGDRFGGQMSQY